jgi:ATP-dependent phosphoenolpyruvate carboxykinase
MRTQDYIVASGANSSGRGPGTRGLQNIQAAHWNLGVAQLVQHALLGYPGELDGTRAPVIRTGRFTGRSLANRCVKYAAIAPLAGVFERMPWLRRGREVHVQDCFVGANADFGMPIRAIAKFASRGGRVIADARAAGAIFYAFCA